MNPEDFKHATRHADAFKCFQADASVWLDLRQMTLTEQQYRWNWFLLGWRGAGWLSTGKV
jgi:hypothetical protein